MELRLYIYICFFSGDVDVFLQFYQYNFFFSGDIHIYIYVCVRICLFVCLSVYMFRYSICVSKWLNVSFHLYINVIFLHSMGGFWLRIIVIKFAFSPEPLKDHNNWARITIKVIKEVPASCSCYYWRFLLSTLGWLFLLQLAVTFVWILKWGPYVKARKQLNELLLCMSTFD